MNKCNAIMQYAYFSFRLAEHTTELLMLVVTYISVYT